MKNFTMTRLFYCTFLWNFVIWSTSSADGHLVQPRSPSKVTLRISHGEQEELTVKLRKTSSFLANNNLPVWSAHENNPDELILMHKMMKRVGRFSIYQNKHQSAAAVYYHELDEFYGTVDIRFIINAIPIANMANQFRTQRELASGVLIRDFPRHNSRKSRSVERQYLPSIIHSPETSGEKYPNDSQPLLRPRRTLREVFYVKVLVIVNHDLLETINDNSDEKITIVHYVLNLFNSVDMLFAKLAGIRVRINIAGIILRTEHEALPLFNSCFGQNEANHMKYMDVRCTNSVIESYLEKYSNVIPPDSYNFPLLLTSYYIRSKWPSKDIIVAGSTVHEQNGPYQIKKHGSTILAVMIIQDQKFFGSFYTIAHEIAHGLGVHSHDEGPYVDEEENCAAYIMKPCDDVCQHCLSWSPISQRMFGDIFSSRDRCFFIKKPSSLRKPGIREIWTANQQCQCYGYEMARVSTRKLVNKVFKVPLKEMCATSLKCVDHDHYTRKAPIPLDGTPCGEDTDGVIKVCWNKRCRRIET